MELWDLLDKTRRPSAQPAAAAIRCVRMNIMWSWRSGR